MTETQWTRNPHRHIDQAHEVLGMLKAITHEIADPESILVVTTSGYFAYGYPDTPRGDAFFYLHPREAAGVNFQTEGYGEHFEAASVSALLDYADQIKRSAERVL